MKFYAGIGSRQTPIPVLQYMTEVARFLNSRGYTLRSGGATGADTAFAQGSTQSEIFSWKDAVPGAFTIAQKIHPAWHACNENARAQHARNVMQVLGSDLHTPVEFLICWTPQGQEVGGTRTALVLAKSKGVPVYNLALPDNVVQLTEFLGTL